MSSTDATIRTKFNDSETAQVRYRTKLNAALINAASSAFQAIDLTKWSAFPAETLASPSVVLCTVPKVAEIQRQVARLRATDELKLDDHNCTSIAKSILFLQNLATGPIPIPVAGWSPESGASLFFDQGGFYGDLEFTGDNIEYFLHWDEPDGPREVFDSEPSEGGKIPHKLLVHLFSRFARSNAEVL